jgi:clan AA aspartic protease (TIGR02281 family)
VGASEVRIPMAIDGHFWVEGRSTAPVKFLVDSGATMTTIGRDTAARRRRPSPARDQLVRTGNGIIRVSRGARTSLEVGPIERDDVGLHVAENDDLNVLGMNFLSSLSAGASRGDGWSWSPDAKPVAPPASITLHNAYYHTLIRQENEAPRKAPPEGAIMTP